MFNVGDRIVYVKHSDYWFQLEIGKIYTVYFLYYDKTIAVLEEEHTYDSNSFVSLKEYRKQKLEKLCLTKEIK